MERAGRPRHRWHNPRDEGEKAGSYRISAFGVSSSIMLELQRWVRLSAHLNSAASGLLMINLKSMDGSGVLRIFGSTLCSGTEIGIFQTSFRLGAGCGSSRRSGERGAPMEILGTRACLPASESESEGNSIFHSGNSADTSPPIRVTDDITTTRKALIT
jgi:hypothetical protein